MDIFVGRALRIAPGTGSRLGVPLSSSITLRSLNVAVNYSDLGHFRIPSRQLRSQALRLWDGCLSCSREHRVRCGITCVLRVAESLSGAAGGKLQVSLAPGVRAGSVYLGQRCILTCGGNRRPNCPKERENCALKRCCY